MNFLELELKQLVKFFSKEKIKYAILGGIAVSIYGEPRLTFDIDVNIILAKSGIDTFLKKARKYGFHLFFKNAKKNIKKTGVIPLKFIKNKNKGRCDVIIAENILEYAAIKRACLRKISSLKAKLITPEDLVIHKITSSRPKDLEDLKSILIYQKGKLDIEYITVLLKKIDKVSPKVKLYKLFLNLKNNL